MTTGKTVSGQQRKNLAAIEQMCGILLLMIRHTQDPALQREFEGLLKGLQESEPCGAMEVRRIDKEIISCLDQIKELLQSKFSRERVFTITADIGLKLYQRKLKVEKHNK